jgi:hypothetical protein
VLACQFDPQANAYFFADSGATDAADVNINEHPDSP